MSNQTIAVDTIESLRLTCKHCNAAVIMPLDTRFPPEKCFNCHRDFPSHALKSLLNELHHTQEELSRNTDRYAVALEVITHDPN